MAREFGRYSPAVPLGVTWEEEIELENEDGSPIDLTGYDIRAQFYTDVPVRVASGGAPMVNPIAEITSAAYYDVAPAWTVLPVALIQTPASDGVIQFKVSVADLWKFAPTNAKARYYWSIILVNKQTEYAIPIVQGRVTFLPARTL